MKNMSTKKLILEKDEQVSPDLFLPRKHGLQFPVVAKNTYKNQRIFQRKMILIKHSFFLGKFDKTFVVFMSKQMQASRCSEGVRNSTYLISKYQCCDAILLTVTFIGNIFCGFMSGVSGVCACLPVRITLIVRIFISNVQQNMELPMKRLQHTQLPKQILENNS